jgi:hypothetical protein
MIHVILARNHGHETGNYVVHAYPHMMAEFTEELRTPGMIVLWLYGALLGWCRGLEPTPELREKMKRRYGYEFEQGATRPNCAGIVSECLRIVTPEGTTMDKPEPQSYAARFAGPTESPSPALRSHTDQLIARSGHLIHKLKAKDTTGQWMYYFVLVQPASERRFLEAIKGGGIIDLDDYGRVIVSCHGETPDQATKNFLRERYGFEV